MNNKLNANFSMRKLLLTALVAGPLATLPAPLWALPSIDAANLTKSANVDVQQVGGNTLNITAPDKAILTWTAFGSGTSAIGVGDTLNYSLPTNGSVLNNVTGNAATTINGTIASNGNVYILNPAGIVIGKTAQISTGGFYASTIAEPAGFFSINGSLSFSGSATSNVVVQGTGTTSGTDVATIQAIGTGNNIYLAGSAVDVQGGKFFGNLTVRSTGTGNTALSSGNHVAFGTTGPVSVNLVGSPLTGGALNVTTAGGSVRLTGGDKGTGVAVLSSGTVTGITTTNAGSGQTASTTAPLVFSGGGGSNAAGTATIVDGQVVSYNITNPGSGYTSAPTVTVNSTVTGQALTVAPAVASTTGAVVITTTGASTNGNISQGSGAFTASTTGTVVTLNAGTGTTAGNVTLNSVDFLTVGASGNNITIIDTANNLVLQSLTAATNLKVSTGGDLTQATGALHSSGGTIDLAAGGSNTLNFTATGNASFGTISTSSTLAITASGDITFANNIATNRNMTVVSTGGQITAAGISSGSTLTLTATSAAGKLTATSIRTNSNGGTINIAGDIAGPTVSGVVTPVPISNANSTLSVTSSSGSITAGVITSGSTLNLTATTGNITTGVIISATLNMTAGGNIAITNNKFTSNPTVTLSGGAGTGGAVTTTWDPVTGQITGAAVTAVGSGYTSSPTLALSGGGGGNTQILGTVLTYQPDKTLNPVATIAVLGNNLSSGGSIVAGGNVNIGGNLTASGGNLAITSTGGSITTAALSTNTGLTLTTSSTAGGISTGTITASTTRQLTINSAGDVSLATIIAPTLVVNSTSGSITQSGAITSTSSATFNALNAITLTNTANDFKNVVLIGGINGVQVTDNNDIVIAGGTAVTGNATITSGAGIASYGTTPPTVIISDPTATATAYAAISTSLTGVSALTVVNAGGGYITAPAVSITGGGGTGATATAVINTSTGVISSIVINDPGTGYTSTPVITIAAPTGVMPTATAVLNTSGVVTSVSVTPNSMKFPTTPTITFSGSGGATATAATSSGNLNTITPLQSGSITLGSQAIDVLSFGGSLTLSTSNGIQGSNGATTYSVITTPANSLRVFGNVSITTNNTDATFGNPNIFGNAANYSYGQINANVGSAKFTVVESQTLNLGTITAGNLDARSTAGNIVNTGRINTGTGVALFSAGTVFTPTDVFLTFSNNAMQNVTIGNARDFTLANTVATVLTAGSNAINGKAATGAVNVTITGGQALSLTTTAGGDYSIVGFNTTGAVTISDPNSITIQNATNAGNNPVSVSAAGVITLGSGIALGSSGLATFTSTGASAGIVDSAPNIRIFGPSSFISDNSITITNSGHSLGAVSLQTTGINGVNGTANITYTEGGTANLNVVTVNSSNNASVPAGSLTVVSTGGGVIQTPTTGSIIVPQPSGATNTVTFTGTNGGVSLTNPATTNSIAPTITISATGNSSVTQSGNITLGNVAVTAGTFDVDTSAAAAKFIAQATGTSIKSYGNAGFKTQAGKITLSNSGNNFGALSLISNQGAAAGNDIAVSETGTLNLGSVNTGTGGKLSVLSENSSIIQTGNITVGGGTALTAQTAGSSITLSSGTTNNNFGGAGITITAAGNVTIQDSNAVTVIAGGTNIGGSLSVRNTVSTLNGEIKDSPGTLTVGGNVLFDTGTNTGSKVNIGSSTASFGAIQFRSGTVNIVENATLNLAAGSIASGNVSLTAAGNIVTSGAGGGSFNGSLQLYSQGNITITNPIFVANGLTFRSIGATDLSALSLAGNLNSIAPINLGASSYKAPSP